MFHLWSRQYALALMVQLVAANVFVRVSIFAVCPARTVLKYSARERQPCPAFLFASLRMSAQHGGEKNVIAPRQRTSTQAGSSFFR
jgi:hypothetical protein